ncbi:uncharacterized protein JCM10292_006162 [Rhodotorula paludigena]|uniref:uncharacterized protein n=1 Tax=Rhodotorula paludigena TaxID=86838 RepID=UPI0031778EC0
MGRDLDSFVTALPAWMHCPVCLEAAYPPVLVCGEQHIVCQSCVGDILAKKRGATCPTCRSAMAKRIEVSPLVKRAFEEYKVKCRHRGCIWVGAVSEEATHATNTCMYRRVPCTLCKVLIAASETQMHIATICPKATIVCPRGGANCGGKQKGVYRRRHSAEHEMTCAEFECRISGCKTRSTRANRIEHERDCSRIRAEQRVLADEVKTLRVQVAKLSAVRPELSEGSLAAPVPAETPNTPMKRSCTTDIAPSPVKMMRTSFGSSAEGGSGHNP